MAGETHSNQSINDHGVIYLSDYSNHAGARPLDSRPVGTTTGKRTNSPVAKELGAYVASLYRSNQTNPAGVSGTMQEAPMPVPQEIASIEVAVARGLNGFGR
jgi:hypothetical protein